MPSLDFALLLIVRLSRSLFIAVIPADTMPTDGRPNWDRIFQSIAERHPATEAGVFFCGVSPPLSAHREGCADDDAVAEGAGLGVAYSVQ